MILNNTFKHISNQFKKISLISLFFFTVFNLIEQISKQTACYPVKQVLSAAFHFVNLAACVP